MQQRLKSLIRRIPIIGPALKSLKGTGDPHLKKVGSLAHNEVLFHHQGIPLPPIRLRDMVRKGAIMAEDFILEGRQVHDAVVTLVHGAGGKVTSGTRVFEFGVGCGRVARHFFAEGCQNFLGTDVDSELIQWCNNNLAGAEGVRFIRNNYTPPLPVEDATLDFGYSISVFTHMTPENQRQWADELGRVMAPGGFLFVSFLERTSSQLPAGVAAIERRDQEFLRSWLGKAEAPEVYFNTYNTRENIEQLFSRHFEIISYAHKVIRNTQSAIIVKRKGASDGQFKG